MQYSFNKKIVLGKSVPSLVGCKLCLASSIDCLGPEVSQCWPPPTELCWKRHQSSSLSRARRRLTRILIYRCHVAWTPDEFVPPRGISNVVVLSLAWRLWELGPFKASLLEKENSINKGSKRTEHHDWALNAGLLPVMWSKWLLYSCNKSWSGTYYAESMGTKSTRWGKNWIGWYI